MFGGEVVSCVRSFGVCRGLQYDGCCLLAQLRETEIADIPWSSRTRHLSSRPRQMSSRTRPMSSRTRSGIQWYANTGLRVVARNDTGTRNDTETRNDKAWVAMSNSLTTGTFAISDFLTLLQVPSIAFLSRRSPASGSRRSADIHQRLRSWALTLRRPCTSRCLAVQ